MKKIIVSIMALTMIGTALVGCGNGDEAADNTESSASKTSSAANNESAEDKITEEDISSEQQDDSSESEADENEQSDAQKPAGSYEDAIREYYDAANNGDFESILRLMYPNRVVDSMYTIMELQGTSLEDAIGVDSIESDYEVTEIVEEKAMETSDLEEIMSSFDMLVKIVETIESYGSDVENLTDEQREEIVNIMMDTENTSTDHIYTVTECYDVTARYMNNGQPDEDYFYVYYIEGEGWKIDNSLRKYVKKAQAASANANAKTLLNAFNIALMDIETEDIKADITGSCLISSDDDKKVNVPADVDVSKVKELAESYFPELTDFDYFVIVQDDACVYAAVCQKDGTGVIGTYPVSTIPKALDDHGLDTEAMAGTKYTLDELYEIAKDII